MGLGSLRLICQFCKRSAGWKTRKKRKSVKHWSAESGGATPRAGRRSMVSEVQGRLVTVHGAVLLGDTPARPVSLQATPTLHKEQYVVPLVMNKRAQRADFPGRLYQILNSPWVQNCNEFLRNNINVYLLLNFTQLTLTCISILRNTPFMLNKRDLLLEKMQMASL